MKIIVDNKFIKYDSPRGILFVCGIINHRKEDLVSFLEQGGFPSGLRGNFCFIYKSKKLGLIAAVDHLCTYPLFYTEECIGNIFYEVLKQVSVPTHNPSIKFQVEILGGQSVGPGTTYREISRLLPGHYYCNGIVKQYCDISSLPIVDKKIESFSNLVENIIVENVSRHNILLISAGTDSVTIAAILRKLGLLEQFDIVHIYSSLQPFSEVKYVKQIAEQMDLSVHYVEQPISGDILPSISRQQYSFWIENPFSSKKMGIKSFYRPESLVWTGELGDQIFGGPKNDILMSYVNQVVDPQYEVVADIWMNQALTYGKSTSYSLDPKLSFMIRENSDAFRAYCDIKQFIVQLLEKMPHKTWIEKFMRLNLIIKGPYRLWSYSQDDWNWFSPFSDYRVVEGALQIPVQEILGPRGTSKFLLWDQWKEWGSQIPWEIAKNGFGVPALSKFRHNSRPIVDKADCSL